MLETSNEPSPGIGPKMVVPHKNGGFITHGLCVPFGLNGLWCVCVCVYTHISEETPIVFINYGMLSNHIYMAVQSGAVCLYLRIYSFPTLASTFIRPFEKRSYYALSESVVRQYEFQDVFHHALKYQFETSYMHSLGNATWLGLV